MASAMAFGWPYQWQSGGGGGVDVVVSSQQHSRRLRIFSPAFRKGAELLVTEDQISLENTFVALESSLEGLEVPRLGEAPVEAEIASTSSNGSTQVIEEKTPERRKKEWTGPIRPRKHPPLPPWTEAQCREKQTEILNELLANDQLEGGGLPVATILDGWLGKVSRVDLANVIKDLDAQGKHALLLEVFYWMQRCKGRLVPKAHLCNMVLGILSRARLIEDAEELFQWIKLQDWDKLRPYNAMIAAYYQAKRPKDAWDVYYQMLAEGIDPDDVTYDILVSGSGKNGYPIDRLFLEIKSRGVALTLRSYNVVICAFTKEGSIDKVEEVIREMIRQELRPDLFSFNALIAAYAMSRKPERGLQVFSNMKAAGVLPDIVTYTTLIQMFSRSAMHKEAIEMFEEMVVNKCQPDFFVYSLLVSVYGKAGLVADALLIFHRLQLEGHRPNIVTYTSLISAHLHKGLLEESRKHFSQMEAYGCRADVHLLNTMIDAYAKAGMVNDAANLLHRLTAQGVCPNRASYAIIVEGFLHAGHVDEALAAYASMSEAGFKDEKMSSRISRRSSPRR
ncbi:pentatricopeptide repeat-containing protein At5g02860 [Selaginella moellendorffii]|nr:pentatricopeptide repeat-containing protein At5g02860 [Selaginella moellendorffii]|eukprot:XP_002971525.2 pentatricopeptide repeat-containing protein At5g02860 [Selaginella moellendorffii]